MARTSALAQLSPLDPSESLKTMDAKSYANYQRSLLNCGLVFIYSSCGEELPLRSAAGRSQLTGAGSPVGGSSPDSSMAKPSLRARSFFQSSYYAANRRTVWAACRAVIFGCIVIAVGLAMTVLGYFDKQFSERVEVIDGTVSIYHDRVVQYQLKSMQYLGPILMGIGSFILIIACVVTLESRDKHTQVISEGTMSFKRKQLLSIEEREEASTNEVVPGEGSFRAREESVNQTTLNQYSIRTLAEVHRPRAATDAPLAEIDSLDLHSCSSQITAERETTLANSDAREAHEIP